MIGRILLSGCAVAVVLSAAPVEAQQVGPTPAPFITTEGQATAEITPDTATVSLGVVSDRPTATAATSDVAKAAQAIVDQITADGIDAKDVTTTSIALTPIYPDDVALARSTSRAPRSFRASTDLSITVKPATRAGAIVSHLVDKGANSIEGIAYTSSQQAKQLDDLKADATRDAMRQAQIYVGALGLRLGRVLEIVPGNTSADTPMMASKMARSTIMAAPAPPIPVEPGALTLRATVSVRWEILQ
ncbi:SIMPL domain-containing protein [Lichenihabitans psoromatis]|uniref:SIMPL domain-containing protein n=1 Tax=Lichenihabitans psoromatis TaxID=2528642 RepID=UPI00103568C0|nr:SIMPL domain-containing protein [Lichenihabitans psoromatis]